jgi:hypothetical protein
VETNVWGGVDVCLRAMECMRVSGKGGVVVQVSSFLGWVENLGCRGVRFMLLGCFICL